MVTGGVKVAFEARLCSVFGYVLPLLWGVVAGCLFARVEVLSGPHKSITVEGRSRFPIGSATVMVQDFSVWGAICVVAS